MAMLSLCADLFGIASGIFFVFSGVKALRANRKQEPDDDDKTPPDQKDDE